MFGESDPECDGLAGTRLGRNPEVSPLRFGIEHGALDLFHEHTLATHRVQRHIGANVARRGDLDECDSPARGGAESVGDGGRLRKRLARGEVLSFMEKLPRATVGMEACGGAHYYR